MARCPARRDDSSRVSALPTPGIELRPPPRPSAPAPPPRAGPTPGAGHTPELATPQTPPSVPGSPASWPPPNAPRGKSVSRGPPVRSPPPPLGPGGAALRGGPPATGSRRAQPPAGTGSGAAGAAAAQRALASRAGPPRSRGASGRGARGPCPGLWQGCGPGVGLGPRAPRSRLGDLVRLPGPPLLRWAGLGGRPEAAVTPQLWTQRSPPHSVHPSSSPGVVSAARGL